MQHYTAKQLAEEELKNKEAASSIPDGAASGHDLDWA
jgi:hypothetical protein